MQQRGHCPLLPLQLTVPESDKVPPMVHIPSAAATLTTVRHWDIPHTRLPRDLKICPLLSILLLPLRPLKTITASHTLKWVTRDTALLLVHNPIINYIIPGILTCTVIALVSVRIYPHTTVVTITLLGNPNGTEGTFPTFHAPRVATAIAGDPCQAWCFPAQSEGLMPLQTLPEAQTSTEVTPVEPEDTSDIFQTPSTPINIDEDSCCQHAFPHCFPSIHAPPPKHCLKSHSAGSQHSPQSRTTNSTHTCTPNKIQLLLALNTVKNSLLCPLRTKTKDPTQQIFHNSPTG